MRPRVILVHGLWMHAPALYYWAKCLRRAEFRPGYFSYRSLLQSPEVAMARLRTVVSAEPGTHIVAHSLGGLMAIRAMADGPNYHGRIVCLGSPLSGSQVVRHYLGTPVAALAGRSGRLLGAGLSAIPDGLDVSVIAGTDPYGLGGMLHHFNEPNDGSVALSETQIPGLRQHVIVAASHSGLLFSKAAVIAALALLRDPPKP